jgi:hypothetical protein
MRRASSSFPVPPVDPGVEFGERVDFWDGDQVVAANQPIWPSTPPFLVGTADAWLAVERVDAVVRSECGPAFGFHPAAREAQHLGDGGSKVVVADLPGRHSAQHVESVDVALEERLLPCRGERAVDGLAR